MTSGLSRELKNLGRSLRDGYRHRSLSARPEPLKVPESLIPHRCQREQFPDAVMSGISSLVVQQHPAFCAFAAAQTVDLAINCASGGCNGGGAVLSDDPYPGAGGVRVGSGLASSSSAGASPPTAPSSGGARRAPAFGENVDPNLHISPNAMTEAEDLTYIYRTAQLGARGDPGVLSCFGPDAYAAILPRPNHERCAVRKCRIRTSEHATGGDSNSLLLFAKDAQHRPTLLFPHELGFCASQQAANQARLFHDNGSSTTSSSSSSHLPSSEQEESATNGNRVSRRSPPALMRPQNAFYALFDDETFPAPFFKYCGFPFLDRFPVFLKKTILEKLLMYDGVPIIALQQYFEAQAAAAGCSVGHVGTEHPNHSHHRHTASNVVHTEYLSGLEDLHSLEQFREILKTLQSGDDRGQFFAIMSYSRQAVGQKHFSGGHVAPLGGYDEASDKVLVLEVNTWRYPSVWMDAETLFNGIRTKTSVGVSRGLLKIYYRGAGEAVLPVGG